MSRCSPGPSPDVASTSWSIPCCIAATASCSRRSSASTSSATIWRITTCGSCSSAGATARPGLRRSPPSRIGSEAPLRLSAISCGFTSSPLATSSATIIAIVCKRLDLVLGILPPRPVLHDEDAEHALAAQDRHAHQRMVDLLAGFRAIGEIGVGLRIGQRQRARGGRDPPDETLADPEAGAMHRLGAQPLGREQFEHLAGAHHIGRADLGDHFGGDDADDLVEPFLGRARAGHDAAQTAQQPASRRNRLGWHVRRRSVRGLDGALLDDLAHSETAPAETAPAETTPAMPGRRVASGRGIGPGARRSRPAPDRPARRGCRRCSARASPCRRFARPSASRPRHRRRSPRGAAPRPRNARFRAARPFATARRG